MEELGRREKCSKQFGLTQNPIFGQCQDLGMPDAVTPPLYLQHQGHSRTVAGVEQLVGGNIKLLILDPSHSTTSLQQNTMRLIRKTLASMKSKQYQVVVVRGVIDSPAKRDSKKVIRSTRIPP